MEHDLERFVVAQEDRGTYAHALAELWSGRKRTHWMWFVFPQLDGLGHSAAATYYGIAGISEAEAYLAHPVLGPRLRECAQVLLELPTTDPVAVLGPVDAVKLRSCMTLFEHAAPEEEVFGRVLDRFFGGERDPATLARL